MAGAAPDDRAARAGARSDYYVRVRATRAAIS
jgi:hypothetical protein